jgi:hypothetical protein
MAANNGGSADVLDLVSLMYRTDWTALSLTAEADEFHDLDALVRTRQPPRPPWARTPPKSPGARHRHAPPQHGSHADDDDADDDDSSDDDDFELPRQRQLRHDLLLLPGGRFRLVSQSEGGWSTTRTSDGRVEWEGVNPEVNAEEGDEDEPQTLSPARPPIEELLCPAWLPANFSLELAGAAVLGGRQAHRVIGRQRPIGTGRARAGRSTPRPAHRASIPSSQPDQSRVDALVDAELGILLRSELTSGGQVVSRYEITSITLGPPEAASMEFTAPPSATDSAGESPFAGPGWERAKRAANVGAGALSFAIRHAPHREPPAGSKPSPEFTPTVGGAEWPGQPGPDEPVAAQVLGLIYEAGLGRSEFDAELHTWGDTASAAGAFRHLTRNTTLSGVNQLADAMTEKATTWQSRERLRVGLPGRYRIDYIDGGQKRRPVTTEASDGSKRWRIFAGYVAVGPARPLPAAVAKLLDPAWLLDWQLTGGAPVIQGGRRGLRVRVGQRWGSEGANASEVPAEVVVDAELGILLQLTQEQSGQPSQQQTLTGLTVQEHRDPSAFVIQIPPGTKVVQDTGGFTDEIEMPPAVHTAIHLAGRAASGAVKIGSFLDSLRGSASGRNQH